MEMQEIENIRDEELRKSINCKEEDKLQSYLKKRQGMSLFKPIWLISIDLE